MAAENGKDPLDPLPFFVYGTLRDDDDSGAEWTAKFVKGASLCEPGTLRGARLYQ